jgi:hypothetical protein
MQQVELQGPTAAEIDKMSPVEFKVAENRARRMAQRQRLLLVKNRRNDPLAADYRTYMLVDPETNVAVAYGYKLGDIYRVLAGDRK